MRDTLVEKATLSNLFWPHCLKWVYSKMKSNCFMVQICFLEFTFYGVYSKGKQTKTLGKSSGKNDDNPQTSSIPTE